jgi:hypothetical protein
MASQGGSLDLQDNTTIESTGVVEILESAQEKQSDRTDTIQDHDQRSGLRSYTSMHFPS